MDITWLRRARVHYDVWMKIRGTDLDSILPSYENELEGLERRLREVIESQCSAGKVLIVVSIYRHPSYLLHESPERHAGDILHYSIGRPSNLVFEQFGGHEPFLPVRCSMW